MSDHFPSRDELNAALRKLNAEAGGAMVLQVVRQQEAEALLVQALAGDRMAGGMLNLAQQVVLRVAGAPASDPAQCAACCRPIRDSGYSIAVALPMVEGPRQGLGYAICHRCGSGVRTVRAKALKAVQAIWPDAREITLTPGQGGNA